MKVGFVGLGIMGRSMSQNLLKAGFELVVWNRTADKTLPLKQNGAEVAPSLTKLAEVSDIVITIVNDTPDVESVFFDESGLLPGLKSGSTIIDMSTISPEATEKFALRLHTAGCEMLDAPVSGGDVGARNGTLTIMVGGRKSVFDDMLPIFRAMGKNIIYCGEHGNGQRTKMINQIICGLHAVALSEAFALAESAGLDTTVMHQVVSSGAAGSWALDNYGPRVLENDWAPGFKLAMQQKDLRIAHETAKGLERTLPGMELAFQLFSQALERGMGEHGSHALVELYRQQLNSNNP